MLSPPSPPTPAPGTFLRSPRPFMYLFFWPAALTLLTSPPTTLPSLHLHSRSVCRSLHSSLARLRAQSEGAAHRCALETQQLEQIADSIFCINPTPPPSLLLSTHPPSSPNCLDVTVCSVTLPILSFSSTSLRPRLPHPPPCSIPPVSPAPAVHGGHHINPAAAQEELKCLWHRRSG